MFKCLEVGLIVPQAYVDYQFIANIAEDQTCLMSIVLKSSQLGFMFGAKLFSAHRLVLYSHLNC